MIKETKRDHWSFILYYTCLWMIGVGILYAVFRRHGASFFFNPDGLRQHFVSFSRLCDWISSIVKKGTFPVFFDFTLGQGADTLTTLNSYDFTDPVSILAACLFPLSRVSRYVVMIFIKFYLIGISFYVYARAVQVMFSIGAAIELHRLGYEMKKLK